LNGLMIASIFFMVSAPGKIVRKSYQKSRIRN